VSDGPAEKAGSPRGLRAAQLLRVRAVWITPALITSIFIALMTVFYVGSVVDPVASLRGLPVLVVNGDQGATVGSQHVNLGQDVVSALDRAPPVSGRLALDSVSLAQARKDMDRNAGYITIVVPAQFTRSVLALYGAGSPAAGRIPPVPAIELLTNGRAGSIGVNLATGVVQPAIMAISRDIGKRLSAQIPAPGRTTANAAAQRSDPVTLISVPYRPLPPHSALGLSAFYLSLLSIMCGFLGAILVNSTVDSALGYATTEVGPRWRQRAPVRISRWQTLLAKWLMALALTPVLTGVMLLVAAGINGVDAPNAWQLWLFTSFAALVTALGTLALFAALGTLGQMVAMLAFIYLALASSGGTIPLQALPPVLKFVANFEPLRQVLDGVRAILYFNAVGDAGLYRGLLLTGIGLIFWVALGIAVTRWYDRRGMDRLEPELLDYVNRSARVYAERKQLPGAGSPGRPPPALPSGQPPVAARQRPPRSEAAARPDFILRLPGPRSGRCLRPGWRACRPR
jgi:YhgE/Pip-like protein